MQPIAPPRHTRPWWADRSTTPDGFARLMFLLAGALALATLFCGCAPQSHLPQGSYAEISGYAKDRGGKAAVGGQILAHIPLGGGFAK